ncbi:hypothetical protein M1L60_02480 [Actinoplanes sp. TRM 88003]|uniref:PH domain-containing protein n=1 Tax=Paractinoplanes aksuensis TaxID=2939490 RepID=A0ABT1DF46_9ACTN|nr:hypothetical protein [Actinoplanes aksuensis]MCO8269454.1 hypothetical protein [Actinoplanes aksuensis]
MARGPAHVNALFETAIQRRVPFLLGTLAVALLLVTGMALAPDLLSGILFAVALLLYLGLVATATAALNYHPRRLIERPGELATVDSPGPVLIAAGVTFLATGLVADDVGDWLGGDEVTPFDIVYTSAWPLLLALSWYTALGKFGVALRSDGIHERRPFGTLFVPWAALDPELAAEPGRLNLVTLRIRHPETVVRRGIRGTNATVRGATDAAYLAGVINSAVTTRAAHH